MKVNDKVVCIKQGKWISVITGLITPGPVYEEEVNINSIFDGYLCLTGYPDNSYNPKQFVPLQDWNEATEFMKESEKEIDDVTKNDGSGEFGRQEG